MTVSELKKEVSQSYQKHIYVRFYVILSIFGFWIPMKPVPQNGCIRIRCEGCSKLPKTCFCMILINFWVSLDFWAPWTHCSQWSHSPNKKVLLREHKRHTAHRVASPGGKGTYLGQGGYLPWWGYLPWQGVPTLAGGGVPTLAKGYLPWLGGTYLGRDGAPPPPQVMKMLPLQLQLKCYKARMKDF